VCKNLHEIRDPIHVFVRMDNAERDVLNSHPFQRLRHIHQLATTYLVYPGATHRRFEHSLGVMELSARVFDVITNPDNVSEQVRDLLTPIAREDERHYWRRVLRVAALCHDMGHLPFSHAAEHELLPEGWDHERLTREIVLSQEMRSIWQDSRPPLDPEDIVKLAIGPKKAPDLPFSDWEAILSEVIVGDAFGVDRMDYLLRDSLHTGVAYGRFDHYRLIDTLRILPPPPSGKGESSREPMLGVEEGGLHSAEALMLARYFMYTQMYFHPIRRIYDIHLKDFLKEWLPTGRFPTNVEDLLRITDNEVAAAMLKAGRDKAAKGHAHATRLLKRQHFKTVYERNPSDVAINPEAGKAIFGGLCQQFGKESIRRDTYTQKGGAPDFPVQMRDGRVESSLASSGVLKTLPVVSIDYVFADRLVYNQAERLVQENRAAIIQTREGEEDNGQT
jgi:HD superfamily phosphohydrolase